MIARLVVLAAMLALPAAAETVPEPDGFRSAPYRAPVPATLRGAQVIDTATAQALHAAGVPFLDAMPRTRKPEGLPAGTIWREPPHDTIPGAIWVWDTGYDRISPPEMGRLDRGLWLATRGDHAAPVVIFCKRDCWMSWNAAKRAVRAGYTGVRWYPDGTDGWAEGGGTLIRAVPAVP